VEEQEYNSQYEQLKLYILPEQHFVFNAKKVFFLNTTIDFAVIA